MNNKKIIYRNNIQKKHLDLTLSKRFNKRYPNVIKDIFSNLNTRKDTFHSLSKNFKLNFKIKDLNKFKKFKTIVIIGMGGSILGSEALYYFLKNKIKKDFIFFNNIDEDKLKRLKSSVDLKKVLFIVVSKSGNTIETLSNFFALNIIKKKSKNIIIISEKSNNILYNLAHKFNLFYIEHKKNIGGRYSILSEVGIIPFYLMGLNIKKFRKRIRDPLSKKNLKFLKESSLKLASFIRSRKFNNIIFINYAPKLDKFLFWCQQLIAESLGKESKGFFPTISTAPKDHHSLLQLYLDGPGDKLFYIFSSGDASKERINFKKILPKANYLNKKKLSTIKNAQKNALIKALKKNNIPFREFKIKSKNEETIGALFSYFILETIILGRLLNINPFDQPAVEQVKDYTKKLLS